MEIKLKVRNMVFTGVLPFRRNLKPGEIRELIQHSNLNWIMPEGRFNFLQAWIKKEETKKNGENKRICITLWQPSKFGIVGAASLKEAQKAMEEAFSDIKKAAPSIFENE